GTTGQRAHFGEVSRREITRGLRLPEPDFELAVHPAGAARGFIFPGQPLQREKPATLLHFLLRNPDVDALGKTRAGTAAANHRAAHLRSPTRTTDGPAWSKMAAEDRRD